MKVKLLSVVNLGADPNNKAKPNYQRIYYPSKEIQDLPLTADQAKELAALKAIEIIAEKAPDPTPPPEETKTTK